MVIPDWMSWRGSAGERVVPSETHEVIGPVFPISLKEFPASVLAIGLSEGLDHLFESALSQCFEITEEAPVDAPFNDEEHREYRHHCCGENGEKESLCNSP